MTYGEVFRQALVEAELKVDETTLELADTVVPGIIHKEVPPDQVAAVKQKVAAELKAVWNETPTLMQEQLRKHLAKN